MNAGALSYHLCTYNLLNRAAEQARLPSQACSAETLLRSFFCPVLDSC